MSHEATIYAGFNVCVDSLAWHSPDNKSEFVGFFMAYPDRVGMDFNTQDIPDSATITKIEIHMHVPYLIGGSPLIDIDEVVGGGSPAGKGAVETYYDLGNGNGRADCYADVRGDSYLSQSDQWQSVGWHHDTLSSTAISDLQNQLENDWFSVGITEHSEIEDTYTTIYLRTSEYCPYIVVTYEVPNWSGKVSGVTNPAKVMGVNGANIAKVKGVASA